MAFMDPLNLELLYTSGGITFYESTAGSSGNTPSNYVYTCVWPLPNVPMMEGNEQDANREITQEEIDEVRRLVLCREDNEERIL